MARPVSSAVRAFARPLAAFVRALVSPVAALTTLGELLDATLEFGERLLRDVELRQALARLVRPLQHPSMSAAYLRVSVRSPPSGEAGL